MVELVPGDVNGQATHGGGVAVYDASAEPGVGRKAGEEGQRRVTHRAVFGQEAGERALLEAGDGVVAVLVEPRQLAGVAAGETQRAIREDALVVGQVADNLLQGPFAGRIGKPVQGDPGERLEEAQGQAGRVLQCRHRIIPRYLVDIRRDLVRE